SRKKDCLKRRSSRSWDVHRSPRTSLSRPSRCELFHIPQPNFCSGLASRIPTCTQNRPRSGSRKPRWRWHTRISVPTSTFSTPTSTPGARPAITTCPSALSDYQSSRQGFESLRSGFLDVLNLDLEERDELVEHESALAELERLTGVDVA